MLELRRAFRPLREAIAHAAGLVERGEGGRGASPKVRLSGCVTDRHLPSHTSTALGSSSTTART